MTATGTAMPGAWWVWPLALVLYGLFRFWYDNRKGPLRADEIEDFLQRSSASPGAAHTDATTLRRFLEQDDGKEFVMCNLIRLHPGPMPHQVSGALTPPRELMQEYVRHFVVSLLLHGGHPVIATRSVGGYIDAWNAPPDAGWTVAAMMRYRSRRDLMKLATQPRFINSYPFKVAAVEKTFSFPTQTLTSLVPVRAVVAVVLMLGAALAHLASLLV